VQQFAFASTNRMHFTAMHSGQFCRIKWFIWSNKQCICLLSASSSSSF